MRLLASTAAGVVALWIIGCGGGSDAQTATPDAIEASIADHCKTRVIRSALPIDPRHTRFRQLAEETMLIGCERNPKNESGYATFESNDHLEEALDSIALPVASVESYCVTEREAFTTDFWGSVPVCKQADGRFQNVRRPPRPNSVTHTTYLPNCGSTSYLEFKPDQWSAGCTAGSVNLRTVTWRRWTEDVAVGSGTAGLRGGCHPGCSEKDAYYKADAKVRFDRPQSCTDQGAVLRFFTRVRWMAYLRPGNPFSRPEGWWTEIYETKAYQGECMLPREELFFGE